MTLVIQSRNMIAIAIAFLDSNCESQIASDLKQCELSETGSIVQLDAQKLALRFEF